MDANTKKRLDEFVGYLKKESRLPLANRFLSEETAEVVAKSWFNQSWSDMMHSELAEEGDKLHHHRTLNKACKRDIPLLISHLNRNLFASTVLDLVEQRKQELDKRGERDPLYLLEMAVALAEMDEVHPTHLHLLKLISFHQDKYGSLEQLRGHESPRDAVRRTLSKEDSSKPHSPLSGTPDFEYVEPDEHTAERLKDAVVKMWTKFEENLSLKVTKLLHDSRSMKQVKTELWQRQELAEALLLKTEADCTDEVLQDQFELDLETKLPAFRREMGKKIASCPMLAEKIYDILENLMERGISAFDYLDIALDISKCSRETVIDVIRMDLLAKGTRYRSHMAIRALLDKYESSST